MGIEKQTTGRTGPLQLSDSAILISDFIEKYENQIKPSLEAGEFSLAYASITDCILRYTHAGDLGVNDYPISQVQVIYDIALRSLREFTNDFSLSVFRKDERFKKQRLDSIDRQVSELDIAMGGLLGERWREERKKWEIN